MYLVTRNPQPRATRLPSCSSKTSWTLLSRMINIVSDATQLAQDSLDKGSPTAGPSSGHRVPSPRPSDACFHLVFPRVSFQVTVRSRAASSIRPLRSGPHKAAAIRWNVIDRQHTLTCHTSMCRGMLAAGPVSPGHPPMQALNFGFRLQTTPEPVSQRPPREFCLGAETNDVFTGLNQRPLQHTHTHAHIPSTLLVCYCAGGFVRVPPCIRSFYTNSIHVVLAIASTASARPMTN